MNATSKKINLKNLRSDINSLRKISSKSTIFKNQLVN